MTKREVNTRIRPMRRSVFKFIVPLFSLTVFKNLLGNLVQEISVKSLLQEDFA
jgi:hypothetical protein